MALPEGVAINVFRLPTVALEARIEGLASVRAARVSARLPDLVEVTIDERDPVLVWQTPSGTWLVDGAGRLFAFEPDAGEGEGLPAPLVTDLRVDSPAATGATLPADDLAVARRLAAITPSLIGSTAPVLELVVRDGDGWVIGDPEGWEAVFGIYTATTRPPSMIGAQVQCLEALLGVREETVRRIFLAPGPETCGTFIAGGGGDRRPRSGETATPAP